MPRPFAILKDATLHFVAQDGFGISSQMTLAALTSLFPFLIFVAALAGFLGSADLANEVARLVFDAWPPAVADPFAREVKAVLTVPSGGLLTLGAALSLYFSTSAIEAMRTGLNRAYGFAETRAWWMLRAQSLAFMTLGSMALLALAFLLVLGPTLLNGLIAWQPAFEPLHGLSQVVRLALASTVLAVGVAGAHRWLPAGRVRLRDAAPGVIATLCASVAFSEAFGLYLRTYLSHYISTYAGLASVMVALVFLNTLSTIFLGGAALNAALLRARAS